MDKDTLKLMGKIAIADGVLSSDEEKLIREYAASISVDSEAFIAQLRREAALNDTKVIEISSNTVKGIEFENYVLRCISKADRMKVVSRSADFKLGRLDILDERSLCPDFQISHTVGRFNVGYWLECKFRAAVNTLIIGQTQLIRYQQTEKESSNPVFIVYGEGNTPSNPSNVYIFDINDVLSEKVAKFTSKGYTILSSKLQKDYEINLMEIGEVIKSKLF